MNKILSHQLTETASYFNSCECTENEIYLLNIILDLCKEYNKLIEEFNNKSHINLKLLRQLHELKK